MISKPILVVDDEKNIRLTLSQALETLGNPIDAAANGEEALSKLKEKEFGLILLDIRMPGMDGMRFLSQVRQQNPDCQCIMLTGNMDQETANSAVNDGLIFRFLSKPCPSDLLRKTLDAAIAQRHSIAPESQ